MADLNSLVAATISKVGELIQKPKMSDKLLVKPPFRFLHDTLCALISTTGFAQGLYDADELDSAKVSEKQQKISFLDKMINIVGICKVRNCQAIIISNIKNFY